ncbi:MAG TPA: NAD(+) synthase [Acidiferrobacteraceae bacterium]|nr:NAD(+) synthase [Acidiferrobacteraceae bacterium]
MSTVLQRDEAESVLHPGVLALDCAAEVARIGERMRETLVRFHRRGVVLGLSGGVDSSVCAALAVAALGPERVVGILMPERESSESSERLARLVARQLGLAEVRVDISAALEGLGCYAVRDDAIRAVVPAYGPGWKSSIGISGGMEGQFNRFDLMVQDPQGRIERVRLPYAQYLAIVAATNYKQRIRKGVEYFHADLHHYAVIGTPNLLEYDQGFFVKNGDGSADLKPIAHLYKTQVYLLARHLKLPEEVCTAIPTTDTYSLPLGQEGFYFALPYHQLDLALYAYNKGIAPEVLAEALGISTEQAAWVYRDLAAKRRNAQYLHAAPVLMADTPV